MNKKWLSLVLCSILAFSAPCSAYAARTATSSDATSADDTFASDDAAISDDTVTEVMDAADLKVEYSVEEPVVKSYDEFNEMQAEVSELGTTMPTSRRAYNINLTKDDPATFTFTSRSVTQHFSGALPAQDTYANVNIALGTGQIVQATLACPNNEALNYDLLLYEFNADGSLGSMVASSETGTYFNTYPDGTRKTVDEGISYINQGSTKNYAVFVYATTGGSDTDLFGLTISLDVAGMYDPREPNDSPYIATGIGSAGNLNDLSMNVENDQDWFLWRTDEFTEATISATSGYKAEVYTASGNTLHLVNSFGTEKSQYSITLNKSYYIRVYSDSDAFTAGSYTLQIIPTNGVASEMFVIFDGDMGKDYVQYPQGVHFRFKNKLTPNVYVITKSGYPSVGVSVSMDWISGSWTEESGNHTVQGSGTTSSGGVAIVEPERKIPVSLGYYSVTLSGAITVTHHYDIDTVEISVSGVPTHTEAVYHFAYSA